MDDYVLHMIGVGMMGSCVTIHLLIHGDTFQHWLLAFAAGVWLLRLVLKVTVVWLYEVDSLWDVPERARHIMYTGRCKEPGKTLVVFKAAGALQWLVFASILSVL